MARYVPVALIKLGLHPALVFALGSAAIGLGLLARADLGVLLTPADGAPSNGQRVHVHRPAQQTFLLGPLAL